MAQNRDRNWQDRDQQQRGRWQSDDDFSQGEHGQHQGFGESQGRSEWNEGREHFGSSQHQGFGQQQGGEWNRMGRYGEEGWQSGGQGSGFGGGMGRFGQGGNYRMDRDDLQHQGSRSGWGGSGFGGSPYVGESSGTRGSGSWGSGYGSSGYGSGGMGSRGGYGSGSYGSGSYGTRSGSGYGSGYGYGSSGYGSSQRQHGGDQQRGFWDRATDEVSSWFGDDDARRRREMDEHRGRGPKGYTRSDERIREDVNDRLTDDGWLDASDVEVQVSSSEVTLTGQVNSREEKRRAEDIADAVSGVKHVQNNLRVKDRASLSSGQGTTTQFGTGSTTSSTGSGSSSSLSGSSGSSGTTSSTKST